MKKNTSAYYRMMLKHNFANPIFSVSGEFSRSWPVWKIEAE
jgi:hypothetical protein